MAVCYEDKFYIGTVIDIKTPFTATETKGTSHKYRWPIIHDVADTDAHFVFMWGFEVSRVNNRSKLWNVRFYNEISEAYSIEKYKATFLIQLSFLAMLDGPHPKRPLSPGNA